MKKFVYIKLLCEDYMTEQELDNFGIEGWELVTIYKNYAYFKREKKEASEEKLDEPININSMPMRVVYAISTIGAKTYRDLANHGRLNLLKERNFGKKSLDYIDALFKEAGLEMYWHKKNNTRI